MSRPKKQTPDKRYINVLLVDDVLTKIDDFRFKHRFPSRTEAIRWLIRAALDQKLKPVPEVT